MRTTVEIVLPIFALVLCGYLAGHRRLLRPEAVQGLSGFVFYLAIPALLFRTMGRGIDPQQADLTVLFAYFGSSFILFFLAVILGRVVFVASLAEQGLFGMSAVYSNTVLLGLPLIYTAFGEAALLPLTLIITFHSILLLPLVTIFVELGRRQAQGWRPALTSVGKALAHNPVVLAILAGLAYGATGWGLPKPAVTFIDLLAGAAAPCALIALGASLTAFRMTGDLKETLTAAGLKLLAHPALVAIFALWIFDLPPIAAAVAIITAALPSGANVFIIAQQYQIYLRRAASVVLVTTGLSVFTVAVLIALFHPG